MSWLVKINGIYGLDGEYPLDFNFKNKHWRTLEKMANLGVLELQPALKAGKTSALVALVAVALDQNSKPFDEEMLWEAGPDALMIEEVKDPDARPPDQESSPKPNESKLLSGEDSNGGGDLSQEKSIPPVTGSPV